MNLFLSASCYLGMLKHLLFTTSMHERGITVKLQAFAFHELITVSRAEFVENEAVRSVLIQYRDRLMQDRGKGENLKLASFLKEICKIESSAEEVSSKTVGRSCRWV